MSIGDKTARAATTDIAIPASDRVLSRYRPATMAIMTYSTITIDRKTPKYIPHKNVMTNPKANNPSARGAGSSSAMSRPRIAIGDQQIAKVWIWIAWSIWKGLNANAKPAI